MNFSELSIKRPVLATVMVLIILIFGAIGYTNLAVREYPNVDNPIITVQVSYPGANAEVIENQITEPLEQNINGIPGIRSLRSQSSQGSSRITVEFELDVDLERAANDVRDKVSIAQRYLPRDADPPIVSKADADSDPIMQITVQSPTRSLLELSEIADLTVKERLQTISDVSAVQIWGEYRYAMRLWLDPIRMAAYNITPIDIKNALDRENVELPAGSIEGDQISQSIRTMGLMQTPEEFNNLILIEDNFRVVRFRDVGYAELDAANRQNIFRRNGVPMVSCVIIPQPGANHINIADEVRLRMEQMKKDLPEDVTLDVAFDNTQFIRASIAEVQTTVIIAFILVVLIIFAFLRNWRVTLIPAVAIPISLIGIFFVMYLVGFSINVLSMLAVVLAVGLVVDDSIVVTENIFHKVEDGMEPEEAAIAGSKEIFFAVISSTITLVAIFIPIVFLEGMTGRLFREFSIVLAGTVLISAFVALSFVPMLSSRLLSRERKNSRFYDKTEVFFTGMNRLYETTLQSFFRRKWLVLPILILAAALIGLFWNIIPAEMAPLEDRSQIIIRTTAPEGATFEFVRDYTDRIAAIADSIVPERESNIVFTRSGFSMVRLILPDIGERERSQMEIAAELARGVRNETAARAFVQQQATFGGRRAGMPIQYVLQAPNIENLQEFIPPFMERVNQSPYFQMADVDLKFTKPETRILIDRDKAAMLGVSTRDIGQTLQYALSGQRMGYFYMNGKQYEILGEINRQQRNTPVDLKTIYIKNINGQMIQMDNLVKLEESVAPPQLYRYNRFNSATISAGLAPGYSLGEGLEEMDRIAADVLDDSFRTALEGESRNFMESSSSLLFAFGLAIILIFLVLAAQFESFKDPFVIMFSVPMALFGALLFIWMTGVTMNIYSQIGIIMLIGLVAKNGILIVEFANQRQESGLSKFNAIIEASVQRLRPILMTSISTILGSLPLMFASGEGANGRIAMGTAVVGGLLISSLLTLFVVPVMYSYFSTDREARERKKKEKMNPA
jgi:multidrug efflux pump